MSDTVERVARAICESQSLDWDAQSDPMTSASGSDEEQEGFRQMARAAIDAMGAGWQPIETAPKDRVGPGSWENHGPRIQVFDGWVSIACWSWHQNGKTGNWKTDDGRVTFKVPTHWMPLPASPSVAGEG